MDIFTITYWLWGSIELSPINWVNRYLFFSGYPIAPDRGPSPEPTITKSFDVGIGVHVISELITWGRCKLPRKLQGAKVESDCSKLKNICRWRYLLSKSSSFAYSLDLGSFWHTLLPLYLMFLLLSPGFAASIMNSIWGHAIGGCC